MHRSWASSGRDVQSKAKWQAREPTERALAEAAGLLLPLHRRTSRQLL